MAGQVDSGEVVSIKLENERLKKQIITYQLEVEDNIKSNKEKDGKIYVLEKKLKAKEKELNNEISEVGKHLDTIQELRLEVAVNVRLIKINQAELDNLRNSVQDLRDERKDLIHELNDLKKEKEKLKEKVNKLKHEIRKNNYREAAVEVENEELGKQLVEIDQRLLAMNYNVKDEPSINTVKSEPSNMPNYNLINVKIEPCIKKKGVVVNQVQLAEIILYGRRKNIDEGSVNELRTLFKKSLKAFFDRLEFTFRNFYIISEYDKLDQLVNKVFFNADGYGKIEGALRSYQEKVNKGLVTLTWEQTSDIIRANDDSLKRLTDTEKNLNELRFKLNKDGGGYEEYIQAFDGAREYWIGHTMEWRVNKLATGLTRKISERFNSVIVDYLADKDINKTTNEDWYKVLRDIVYSAKWTNSILNQEQLRKELNRKGGSYNGGGNSNNDRASNNSASNKYSGSSSDGSANYKQDRPKFKSGACFNCGEEGHLKRNCPIIIESDDKPNLA